MNYIADAIGNEYKKWGAGETIFISAPTGSGKTTFILKVLLPYLKSQRKKVLYLVNRRVLKKQIETEIEQLPIELKEIIKIELYQTIENKILSFTKRSYLPKYWQGYYDALENRLSPEEKNDLRNRLNNYKKIEYCVNKYSGMQGYKEYDYVVCDEAHYFLMDSNYNTNTIMSYNFVRDFFCEKVRIYMSATLEDVKEYIKKDNQENRYLRTDWFGVHTDKAGVYGWFKHREYEYSAERKYDYIDIKVLKDRSEISDIVCNGNKKWLIFVDSKEFGMLLKQEILKKMSVGNETSKNEMVVFITSGYAEEQDSANQVGEIIHNNKQSVKVLIATSVLDNGINLKDIELRNIILIADTETEFIQMLGRKRRDGQRLQLYLYKQSKEHFLRRQRKNSRRREKADDNYMEVRNYTKQLFDEYYKNGNVNEYTIGIINEEEKEQIWIQHQILMKRAMNNIEFFKDLSTAFLSVGGILFLNLLSRKNLENLSLFYNEIVSEFESRGENAFLRKQLQWLNKTEEEIEGILTEADLTEFEKSKNKVICALENIAGKELEKADFIKFKNEIRDDIMILLNSLSKEQPDWEKYRDSANKNDRPISKQLMDFLRQNCEIPFYIMEENKKYTVMREED